MSREKNILVATDLSARCDRATERALLLAREKQASVTILHVHEGKNRLTSEEEEDIRRIVREDFNLDQADVEVLIEHGTVPATIANVAEQRNCALIVTGVARFNSERDVFLGTAVDYLIRQAPVPVLVVKRRARHDYRRIVMPSDFSDADTQALIAASGFFDDGQFLLVHAYQASFPAFLEHDSSARFAEEEAESAMGELVNQLPPALQARTETKVAEGRLHAVLLRQIREWQADLLVLGSESGPRGYAHAVTGDDRWQLPATQPCDVLVVRRSKGRSGRSGEDRSEASA